MRTCIDCKHMQLSLGTVGDVSFTGNVSCARSKQTPIDDDSREPMADLRKWVTFADRCDGFELAQEP